MTIRAAIWYWINAALWALTVKPFTLTGSIFVILGLYVGYRLYLEGKNS